MQMIRSLTLPCLLKTGCHLMLFFKCILDIKSWMTGQFLRLNQEEMMVLVIGPKALREKLNCKKKLGVALDSNQTFKHSIRRMTKN